MSKPTDPDTPFNRFAKLTKGLLQVPKKEIDRKLAEFKRDKSRKRKAVPRRKHA